MNFEYVNFFNQGKLFLTDFNCASFDKRLGEGDFYKIIWAKDNDLNLLIDGYDLELKKNHVIFCTPLNILNIKPYTKGVISYVFNKDFYCTRDHDKEVSCNGFLFFGSSFQPIIKLSEKEQNSFNVLFMLFEEELENNDLIQNEMLILLLKKLLITSTRIAKRSLLSSKNLNPKLELIRQFNILVETHFKEKHKVLDYAKMLNKSPKTLSNLFKKSYHKSPLKIINERIILEAKRLLMFSNKSTQEISFILGYTEVSSFSKFFKKHTNYTPKKFKEHKVWEQSTTTREQ